jgi:hypothetical protein
LTSKIYFDLDKVNTWAIDDMESFEDSKWILRKVSFAKEDEISGTSKWVMEWHEEKDT